MAAHMTSTSKFLLLWFDGNWPVLNTAETDHDLTATNAFGGDHVNVVLPYAILFHEYVVVGGQLHKVKEMWRF